MLSLFRTNQILTGVLLLPYVILLYASTFIFPSEQVVPENGSILSDIVYNWLGNRILLSNIIAGLLLWLQSFIINGIVIRHRLQNDLNLFAGLFYILLSCCFPDFRYLSPVLMGNTFLIIALSQILDAYKKTPVADKIFNVGFWLGIAGLFYFSFTYLVLWGIIGIATLRAFRLKEVFQLFTGLVLVCFLTGTYFYWTNSFDYFSEVQFENNSAFGDLSFKDLKSYSLEGGITAVLIIIALLSFSKFTSKKVMQVQRKISVIYRMLFVLFLTLLFQKNIGIEHLLMFMVPLSFFAAVYFTDMRKSVAETLHLLVLVAILAVGFSPLFGNIF